MVNIPITSTEIAGSGKDLTSNFVRALLLEIGDAGALAFIERNQPEAIQRRKMSGEDAVILTDKEKEIFSLLKRRQFLLSSIVTAAGTIPAMGLFSFLMTSSDEDRNKSKLSTAQQILIYMAPLALIGGIAIGKFIEEWKAGKLKHVDPYENISKEAHEFVVAVNPELIKYLRSLPEPASHRR